MKITDLRNKITTLSRTELEALLLQLYKKNIECKELIEAKFDPDLEARASKKYKKQITSEFLPDRGFGRLRYSVMRKALKNFRDISTNHELVTEFMMIHVEQGVAFTNEYGDIDERFYDNIAGMYAKALRYIADYNLHTKFKQRCRAVVDQTEGIGWGFHDELHDLYLDYQAEEQ